MKQINQYKIFHTWSLNAIGQPKVSAKYKECKKAHRIFSGQLVHLPIINKDNKNELISTLLLFIIII